MTLVQVVRLLFELDDDVTGLLAWLVIAVAVEEELVLAADALVHVDLKVPENDFQFIFACFSVFIFGTLINFGLRILHIPSTYLEDLSDVNVSLFEQ